MSQVRTIADWMADRGLDRDAVVARSALDRKVVDAILQGRYTPSPQQRQRLANVLGVCPEQVQWGHTAPVEHIYGHGPQFGRSP